MSAQKLSHFFDPKKVGESLSEVALELIQVEDQEIQSRWFHSEMETDVFVWTDKRSQLIKQQITFYGQVVEWNYLDGIKTGVVLEDEIDRKQKASQIIQFDKGIQQTSLQMACDIIEYSLLPVDIKQDFLSNLKSQTPRETINKGFARVLKKIFKKI